MVNSRKIKGRLVELGLTQKDVAEKIGVAQPTANQKINNIRPMDLQEAEAIANLLKISPGEFADYFFYIGVAQCNINNEQKRRANE